MPTPGPLVSQLDGCESTEQLKKITKPSKPRKRPGEGEGMATVR